MHPPLSSNQNIHLFANLPFFLFFQTLFASYLQIYSISCLLAMYGSKRLAETFPTVCLPPLSAIEIERHGSKAVLIQIQITVLTLTLTLTLTLILTPPP